MQRAGVAGVVVGPGFGCCGFGCHCGEWYGFIGVGLYLVRVNIKLFCADFRFFVAEVLVIVPLKFSGGPLSYLNQVLEMVTCGYPK